MPCLLDTLKQEMGPQSFEKLHSYDFPGHTPCLNFYTLKSHARGFPNLALHVSNSTVLESEDDLVSVSPLSITLLEALSDSSA